MRPIKLTMSAFGPYAGVQVLDMTRLGETGLYAITGETGAGKTTVFDAIMYALYATGSGEDRDGRNLRSVYASDDVETYVELTFSSAGKEYRIRRSPAQRLRGNKTDTQAKVALKYLPNGRVITRNDETARLIRDEIIGVDAVQFSQIVMIAQGEFRRLVCAKSKERTEILRRIFKTENYKQLERLLDEACKAKCGEYNDTRKEILTALKNMRAAEDSELAERLAALQSAKAEALCIEDALELAGRIVSEDDEMHSRAESEKRDAGKARDAAKKEHDAAAEVKKKREALSQLNKTAAALETERADRTERRERAENARPEIERLSREITTVKNQLPEYEELDELDGKAKESEKTAAGAKISADAAAKKLLEIGDKKHRLGDESERIKDAADRKASAKVRLSELSAVGEKLSAFAERLKKRDAAADALSKARTALKKAETKEERAANARDELKKEQAALGNTELAFSECKAKLKECSDVSQILQARLKLIGDWLTAKSDHETALEIYEQSKRKAETLGEKARCLRDRYNDDIAGVLASGLEDGQPCPVCGSVHHPKPALLTEAVDRDKVETAEKKASEAERVANDNAQICSGKKSVMDGYGRQLAEQMPDTEEEKRQSDTESAINENLALRVALEGELRKAGEAVSRAGSLAEKLLPEADKAYDAAREQKQRAVTELATAENSLEAAKDEVAKASASLLPEGRSAEALPDLTECNKRDRETEKVKLAQAEKDLERLDEIKRILRDMEAEKEKQTGILNAKNTEAAQEKEKLKGLLDQITEKRGRLDYATKAEAEKAIIQKNEKKAGLDREIESAAKALQETEKAIAENAGKINTLREELCDKPDFDIARLEQNMNNTQAAFDRAEKTERDIYSARMSNKRQRKILEEKSEAAVGLEREYTMMQDVAATASGKINGQAKITLETYVQMALFDRILRHANIRLRHMSGEQYELKRRDVKEAGSQGQTGLDLNVIDHYNGTDREVATLSGGESFLAALSLALGMSDMIQAGAASAVRLDTMFVDEGFGSLSGNFLALAMDELIDTADSGRRLIGIISHVEDVKNRLPRRIEVTKQPSGGSVAVIR